MAAVALFLSGPMEGLPAYNAAAFVEAAAKLRAAGYTVVSAHEAAPAGERIPLRDAVKLMLECDHVAVLEGWRKSRGALVEVMVAHAVGMDVALVEPWLCLDRTRAGLTSEPTEQEN
jgi:hypothetical protein